MATHELLLMVKEELPNLLSVKFVLFPLDVYTVFPLDKIGLAVMAESWQIIAPPQSNALMNRQFLLFIASPW